MTNELLSKYLITEHICYCLTNNFRLHDYYLFTYFSYINKNLDTSINNISFKDFELVYN